MQHPAIFLAQKTLHIVRLWGVTGREQRCSVLPGSAGSCLLYIAVKCWGLPGSAWGQLDLPMTQDMSTVAGLAEDTACLGWLYDIHDQPLPSSSDSIPLTIPSGYVRSDTQGAILFGQQRMLHCCLQKKMSYECLVPHESSCRKRGVNQSSWPGSHLPSVSTFTQITQLLASCW